MRYHNITKNDMKNGDGIRVVLWVSGCLHHCKGCHNPETWNPKSGIPFDDSAKEEIFHELSKDYVTGLTLSGGDPLHPNNRLEITDLVKEIKEIFPEKTIWLYTGYLFDEIQDLDVIDYIDVIVDGKYKKELPPAQWVGSNNQQVIRLC